MKRSGRLKQELQASVDVAGLRVVVMSAHVPIIGRCGGIEEAAHGAAPQYRLYLFQLNWY
jgi:hypothetical protein